MSSPPERRRRLDPQSDPDAEGRRGCITVGAVLGVLLGVVLGLLVLPRVLDSFLAGDEVSVGGIYSGDARVLSIGRVVSGDDVILKEDGSTVAGTSIELNVLSRKTWLIEPGFFQLELSSRDDWIEAMEAIAGIPGTSFEFGLGEDRTLLLQFEHDAGEGEPVSLHLSDPSISFDLSPASE